MAVPNGSVPGAEPGDPKKSESPPAPSGKKELKIVIVGDGGCGKTSLLMVYAKGAFPEKYAPSVFEKYTTSITVGNKEVILNLYDTAGQEDYDRLRPLSYQNTNMVLICYDVMNPTSYDNVLIKWYPEVSHFCRGVPLILIGCKTDLRKDKEHLRKLMSSEQEPITYNQVKRIAFKSSVLCTSNRYISYNMVLLLMNSKHCHENLDTERSISPQRLLLLIDAKFTIQAPLYKH
ncbi:rho-related GTP-binding protein RhoF isoform X1 [Malaclemys terrapin pileata]|uniref:rho-related GTP-binding protein RhoF isoform X1 n=1 Tax=Malaclemys terrapin pileata TaxID=2991368 RepID=UPI0023A902E5|nr:rho-related GTP-binding protein RhoF isoform X1 [Malaclemys terrapin pileata]